MNRKYAYIFSIGNGAVTWSGETEETLRKRVTKCPYCKPEDIQAMEQLIRANKVGYLCSLPVGDIIVQIA